MIVMITAKTASVYAARREGVLGAILLMRLAPLPDARSPIDRGPSIVLS
jgi:hypothetical protein